MINQTFQIKWKTFGQSCVNLVFQKVINLFSPLDNFAVSIVNHLNDRIKYPQKVLAIFQNRFFDNFDNVVQSIASGLLYFHFLVFEASEDWVEQLLEVVMRFLLIKRHSHDRDTIETCTFPHSIVFLGAKIKLLDLCFNHTILL
jgi:hypothetical protein